ncbi:hypothetical protein BH09ACT7_BH09ACT7_08340 [soil metagenome]
MTCTVCDGYTDADGNDRATPDPQSLATDGLRSQRLTRAALTGDEVAMQRVLAEIGDCRNCMGRQVMFGVGGHAQLLIDKYGTDGAIKAVEAGLAHDILDDQHGFYDEGGPPPK